MWLVKVLMFELFGRCRILEFRKGRWPWCFVFRKGAHGKSKVLLNRELMLNLLSTALSQKSLTYCILEPPFWLSFQFMIYSTENNFRDNLLRETQHCCQKFWGNFLGTPLDTLVFFINWVSVDLLLKPYLFADFCSHENSINYRYW